MKKLLVDILLFVLMILEFSRMYMPTIIHEIIGILLMGLVIIHLVLNWNYIKNIFKGKYDLKKVIMLIVNALFMISLFLSLIFGILSSQDLLKFMNIGNLDIISLHKIMAYVSLLCMACHLGLNFNAMFGKVVKLINNKIVIFIMGIVIVGLGMYSWINLDIWNHLIGKYGFSIVTGNLFVNILEYLSIVLMMTIIINFIYKRLDRKGR